MINGKTKICGLIGNPVEHTLSPLIHNTLANELGLNFKYVPFLVEEKLQQAIEGAYALHILGLNVTVPYKSDVIPFTMELDELAEKIGAVNTLVRMDGGYKGYNTDITGLYRGMQAEGIEIKDASVLILGAGGAARAVAFLCAQKEAKEIIILNRTKEKAAKIAEEINCSYGKEIATSLLLDEHFLLEDKRYLAIQATSVGLSPHETEAPIYEKEFYKKINMAYDLIYRPTNTKFMQLVKEQGGKAYHGLTMLLYQGIEAFELWNGCKLPDECIRTVYKKMKEEMQIDE
ncbi:MAG: shikimate dehydrogenase [Lachnospiraceae bacterium]